MEHARRSLAVDCSPLGESGQEFYGRAGSGSREQTTRGAAVSYLEDSHVAAVNDAPEGLDGVKSCALDPQSAERLWEVSEHLVGERFALRP